MNNGLNQSWQWIVDDDLLEVFKELNSLYERDPELISGTAMSFVVKRLLNCELEVGGPYLNQNNEVDSVTNTMIDRFLRRTGTELPKLLPFHKPDPATAAWPTETHHRDDYESILNSIQSQITRLPPSVRPVAMQMWRSVKQVDRNGEMGQIATFFTESLLQGKRPTKHQLQELGVANFYVWIAYTIYDDFFDDEGIPERLPVANIAMRYSWDGYRSIWKNHQSRQLVDEVFQGMDAANAWEVANARAIVSNSKITISSMPHYGEKKVLAYRAMAHILGPLLIALNAQVTDKQYLLIKRGLIQFLISRQLNDDIHDWRKDLQAGHLSPVVVHILQACGAETGTYDIEKIVAKAENYFWEQGLKELCHITLRHIKKSRRAFSMSHILDQDGHFQFLVDRLEDAIIAGWAKYKVDRDFSRSYRSLERGL